MIRHVASYALAFAALLVLGAGTAHADLWQVTFTGALSGSGSFTTDGQCSICSNLTGSIETFTANLGADSGASAFDIADDWSAVTFTRSTQSLSLSGLLNSETGDTLAILGNNWYLTTPQWVVSSGTYTVTDPPSLPEPGPAVMLSMLLLGLVGWRVAARAKA